MLSMPSPLKLLQEMMVSVANTSSISMKLATESLELVHCYHVLVLLSNEVLKYQGRDSGSFQD